MSGSAPYITLGEYGIKTEIYLLPGFYIFMSLPEDQRVKLCSLFRKYDRSGKTCAVYTHLDYLDHKPLPHNAKVLFLDEYDLYKGVMAEEIIDISHDTIVFLNCKTGTKLSRKPGSCYIKCKDPGLVVIRGIKI